MVSNIEFYNFAILNLMVTVGRLSSSANIYLIRINIDMIDARTLSSAVTFKLVPFFRVVVEDFTRSVNLQPDPVNITLRLILDRIPKNVSLRNLNDSKRTEISATSSSRFRAR